MQRQAIDVHRRLVESNELAYSLISPNYLREYSGGNLCAARDRSACCQLFAHRVINRYPHETFAVAETIHNPAKLRLRVAFIEGRFDRFLKAFGENLAPAFKIRTESLFFGRHLVSGDNERNQGDTRDKGQ